MTTPQTQSSPPLPPTMPVLTGLNIHKGGYDGPNGTHCLLGWRNAVVAYFTTGWHAITAALVRSTGSEWVSRFSDESPPEKSAEAWNNMARSLGYVLSPDKSHFILPTPTTGEEQQR